MIDKALPVRARRYFATPPVLEQSINDMKLYMVIGLVLVFFLVNAATLSAQGSERVTGGGQDSSLRQLNLTEEQYNAIRRAKSAHVKKIVQLKNDAVGKHHEFRRLIGDPAASEEAIRNKAREIEAVNSQIMREMIEYELLVRRILTPEQIRQWSSLEDSPPIRKSSGR